MAMKFAGKHISGLRYKLRMIGIPFTDPCFLYRDNKSVLYNTKLPESTLKKKSTILLIMLLEKELLLDSSLLDMNRRIKMSQTC